MDAAESSSPPQQLRQQQQDVMPEAATAPAPRTDAAPTAAQQAANAQAGSSTVARMATQDTSGAHLTVGEVGRLTQPIKSPVPNADGKTGMLPAGTIVRISGLAPGKILVEKEVAVGQPALPAFMIAPSQFHVEPDMMNNPAEGVLEGKAHYANVKGNLWDPATGPTPDQARHQGEAGDCYFISSMAAVCAQNPKQIEALFNNHPKVGVPVQKVYSVSLYKPNDTNTALVKQTVQVDHWLPESNAGNDLNLPANDLVYEGITMPGANTTPTDITPGTKSPHMYFWAELLEKAFALIYGGYNAIGSGGWPSAGLEALTGVQSDAEYTPDQGGTLGPPPGMDAGTFVLQKFQGFEKQGKAVVVGTLATWGTDKDLGPFGLYGSHAYQFVKLDGTNLIFKNPWGFDDPQPVPADQFLTVFNDVGSNAGNMVPSSVAAASAAPKTPANATKGSMAPTSAAVRNQNG